MTLKFSIFLSLFEYSLFEDFRAAIKKYTALCSVLFLTRFLTYVLCGPFVGSPWHVGQREEPVLQQLVNLGGLGQRPGHPEVQKTDSETPTKLE